MISRGEYNDSLEEFGFACLVDRGTSISEADDANQNSASLTYLHSSSPPDISSMTPDEQYYVQ